MPTVPRPPSRLLALVGLLLAALAGCAVDTDDDFVAADADARSDQQDLAGDTPDAGPEDSGRRDLEPRPDADGEDTTLDTPEDPADPEVTPDADEPDDTSSGETTGDATADAELGIDLGGADVDECLVSHTRPSGSRPYVLVGTGVTEYEPVANCDELPIINGIQGGQHVWGGFEADGFRTSELVNIGFDMYVDGERVAFAEYVDRLVLVGERYEYPGVAVVLDEVSGEDISGRPAVMRLRVWNDGGLDLRDEVAFTPICCDF